MELGEGLVAAGFALVFIGIVLVFIGVLFSAFKGGARAEGGAVVLVGPIPVVFATSHSAAKIVLALTVVLTVLALLLFLLPRIMGVG